MLTPCSECKGLGVKEIGSEETVCPECFGMQTLEAKDILLALQAVRVADAVDRSMGGNGMGAGLRNKVARAWASLPHHTQRYAEVRS